MAHPGTPGHILARFYSSGHNLMNSECAKLEISSEARVSLHLLRDWKQDRERWERELSRLHVKDRSQSVIIAELKVPHARLLCALFLG